MLYIIKTRLYNTEIFGVLHYLCYVTKKKVIQHIPTFQMDQSVQPGLWRMCLLVEYLLGAF